MCRLLVMNNEGYNELGSKKALYLLNYLETTLGGHGNGFLLIKNNEIIKYKKGVKLSNKQIIKDIEENLDFDYFLYHTRLASVGSICDRNCHPFVDKEKKYALMMNGTENQIAILAKSLNMTDTEFIFQILYKNNIDIEVLNQFTSNFIYYNRNEGIYIVNNKGLNFINFKNNGFVISSSFPTDFYSKYNVQNLNKGVIDITKNKIKTTRYDYFNSSIFSYLT